MTSLIYVVDDDSQVREIISRYLLNGGYRVQAFSQGRDVLAAVNQCTPDLIILDIMMPDQDGYEVCHAIRAVSTVPIIFVSARNQEPDRVMGLEIGGDDYLSKPFSPRELVARVKTVLRRVPPKAVTGNLCLAGDLEADIAARRIRRGSQELELTGKEFDLLHYFLSNKDKAFNREQLLNQVWGYEYPGDSRSVDDLVKRLRKKLRIAGSTVEIKTLWGFGYKLEAGK